MPIPTDAAVALELRRLAEAFEQLQNETKLLGGEVRAVLLNRRAYAEAAVVMAGALDAFPDRAFTASQLLDHASVDLPGRRLLRSALPTSSKGTGRLLASLADVTIDGATLKAEQGRSCLLFRVVRVSDEQTYTWPPRLPSERART